MVDKVLRLTVDTTKAKQDVSEFARDTGTKLNKARKIKLEANVATATIKLQNIRSQLKKV